MQKGDVPGGAAGQKRSFVEHKMTMLILFSTYLNVSW